MITEQDVYKIGQLTRTHGVKGELSCSFTDDVWDRADADYVFLLLDGCFIPFFFEEWRFRSDAVCLFKFRDIDTIEQAEELCGAEVWFPHALTPDVSAETDLSEMPLKRLTGYTVVADGERIGEIESVDDSTANVLFVLSDGRFIPAAAPFITSIDAHGRIVNMTLPEGLLDQ
ncbi:MAG: 16S rRNA processing protein RimM [Bacteroidaceae bacterium]|nr:16S rRNA processing protein RimM [Bacteroidaceae bacterium]